MKNVKDMVMKNNVTVLFTVLCVGAFTVSPSSLEFLFNELFTRIGRNTFLVLSLIIPVVAGLGLNFGIVIGAIAAQIAIFFVVLWGGSGFGGLMACVAIATPLSILFGYLVGRLFNTMKGTEMIGGLVAGFFSDGLYQFLFLFVLGGIITVNSPLMISTGVGVLNTINLRDSIRGSLDNVSMIAILDVLFWVALVLTVGMLAFRKIKRHDLQLKKVLTFFIPVAVAYGLSFIGPVSVFLSAERLQLLYAVEIIILCIALRGVYHIILEKAVAKKPGIPQQPIAHIVAAGLIYLLTYYPPLFNALQKVNLPVLTYLCIGALYFFIPWFMNTKLGQDMRTVGQDRVVAASSGIDVDRTRIIAMIMSTVLASYGQIISLQNIGTVATYGAHQQVGLYAIAALLVGGASVQRANTKQAVLGVVLFHTLFILSPNAGQALFGDAQIGEYFRVFVAYGVIAMALAMHAWVKRKNVA